MSCIKFGLPKPPSLNHIYGFTSQGGFARSYITKEGKEWFQKAIAILQEKSTNVEYPISSKVWVKLDLYTCRIQDIDNIIKPTLDLMGSCCLECGEKFTARKPCKCGNKKSFLVNDNLVWILEVRKHKTEHKEDESIYIDVTQLLI